jgi:hypothetical protein
MNLQTLANLGEFIGAIAVVASLAYLALQVRQNTKSVHSENYARALDRVSAMQGQLSRDAELSELFARGLVALGSLTPAERIRFSWALFEAFGAFEFMFHSAEARTLPPEVWTRWSATTAWWLHFPGVQSWWQSRPVPFSASFSAHVDELLREPPIDAAALERWQGFVAGAEPPRARDPA